MLRATPEEGGHSRAHRQGCVLSLSVSVALQASVALHFSVSLEGFGQPPKKGPHPRASGHPRRRVRPLSLSLSRFTGLSRFTFLSQPHPRGLPGKGNSNSHGARLVHLSQKKGVTPARTGTVKAGEPWGHTSL